MAILCCAAKKQPPRHTYTLNTSYCIYSLIFRIKWLESIEKLYFLVSRKPARGLPTPSPPTLRKLPPHIFHVVAGKVRFAGATFTSGNLSREGEGGGRGDLLHSITDHRIDCKFKTKIANSILLLCYLDKNCLILTGGLKQALANQWREAIKQPPWHSNDFFVHFFKSLINTFFTFFWC